METSDGTQADGNVLFGIRPSQLVEYFSDCMVPVANPFMVLVCLMMRNQLFERITGQKLDNLTKKCNLAHGEGILVCGKTKIRASAQSLLLYASKFILDGSGFK